MIYIDANVFLFNIFKNSAFHRESNEFLCEVQSGVIAAATSVLTIDEVLYAYILNELGREVHKEPKLLDSIKDKVERICNDIIGIRNLVLIPPSISIVRSAVSLIGECRLLPRDAIHSATMIENNIDRIISNDSDFDRVPMLKRIRVEDFAQAEKESK